MDFIQNDLRKNNANKIVFVKLRKSINQWIEQSINQSINQWIERSINQSRENEFSSIKQSTQTSVYHVVILQHPVALRFPHQHAIRHVFDFCVWAWRILKSHGITHFLAQITAIFLRNSSGNANRSHTTRLGARDFPFVSAEKIVKHFVGQKLGNLRGFTRSGITDDDNHRGGLVLGEKFRDLRLKSSHLKGKKYHYWVGQSINQSIIRIKIVWMPTLTGSWDMVFSREGWRLAWLAVRFMGNATPGDIIRTSQVLFPSYRGRRKIKKGLKQEKIEMLCFMACRLWQVLNLHSVVVSCSSQRLIITLHYYSTIRSIMSRIISNQLSLISWL